VLAAALLLIGPSAFTDDTQLLRFDTAKPYVFIVLDTSASMGLAFDTETDRWTPGGADGAGSRLYQAKQALYNTFENVSDVHFGFAGFNQDQVWAVEKHWLYYHLGFDGDWPIPFPAADADGLTRLEGVPFVDENGDPVQKFDTDGNEILPPQDTRVLDLEGHLLTFGRAFGGVREAGSCAAPLNFNLEADLRKLQSFAIDGRPQVVAADGTVTDALPSRLWLTNGLNGANRRNYLLTVERPGTGSDGSPNKKIGEDSMLVHLRLYAYSGCPFSPPSDADFRQAVQLRLDPALGETFFIDGDLVNDSSQNGKEEIADGARLWSHQDAFSEAAFDRSPFTGEGWEGNYDSGYIVAVDADFQAKLDANVVDQYCADSGAYSDGIVDPGACASAYKSTVRPTEATTFDPQDRHSLDYGDMIPFDWGFDRQSLFLSKLSPKGTPDYRGASYFADEPLAEGTVTPLGTVSRPLPLPLKVGNQRPLLALDQSPLARAINDVRCWYLGTRGQGTNKCKGENPLIEVGWEELACEFDSRFGCRKPYMIIISDGQDNVQGENPVADASDLFNKSGMRVWAINLGRPRECDNGLLHNIVNAAGRGNVASGACINASNPRQLRQELEAILGQIRTETRAFASAAVPTVQATVEQKIFLTNFTPFNDSGVWDGHVQSFLKPLPVDDITGRPDTDRPCTATRTTECYLWDAGGNLLDFQYAVADDSVDPSLQVPLLDDSEDQPRRRRVYYAERAEETGRWAEQRHLFQQPPLDTDPITGDSVAAEQHLDLWDGLGIAAPTVPADVQPAFDEAQSVIDHTLRKKIGTKKDTVAGEDTVITFLLGDIFHSTPQVVGTPANVFYFASDYPLMGAAGGECDADPADNENIGYRCFFERQRLRRKMLLVGANDGQLHAFDAGRFRGHDDGGARDFFTNEPLVCSLADTTDPADDCFGRNPTPFGSFDNGTGLELFSYVPRSVMSTLNEQEDLSSKHFFSVDGNITVADVFIDPVRETSGGAFPVDAEREWRTVAIGSLREGGAGYYALDITAPDPVEVHADLGFVSVVGTPALNNPASADYLPGCLKGATGCGPVDFPSVVWEFDDSFWDEATGKWYRVDEDLAWMEDEDSPVTGTVPDPNAADFDEPWWNEHDLGDSWSTANVGLIRVCRAGGSQCAPGEEDVEDLFVAVFGGGMDVDGKLNPLEQTSRGNWLYMVDIETGETIYKQRLDGAAPSEPAAVDTNGDSLIDRIYIGTLAGYLYRVDVGTVGGSYPALEPTSIDGIAGDGSRLTVDRDRIPRDVWLPVKLFDTNVELTPGVDGSEDTLGSASQVRPIYYRPSVIFRAGETDFALAFGTGDREDLWSLSASDAKQNGRFYVFVDEFDATSDITAPLDESDLTRIDAATTPVEQGGDLLSTGGWYLVLAPDERVITEAFALSGLTIFSAYVPQTFVGQDTTADEDATNPEEDRVCGVDIAAVEADAVCSQRGVSNIYVVNTTNADGLLTVAGSRARSKAVADFVTNPFTEPGQTKSRTSGDGDGDGEDDGSSADELTPDLAEVMESLKDLFPPQCKFANYRVDVKTIAADTSLQFIAPVPVCIIEHNWKEY
jgi:hypothetical protein